MPLEPDGAALEAALLARAALQPVERSCIVLMLSGVARGARAVKR